MRITHNNFLATLREAVPTLPIDPESASDNLGYVIVNDMARQVCEWARLEDQAAVKGALNFLEACLASGDSYVQDLVDEFLDTISSCDRIDLIEMNFGPLSRAVWRARS